MNRFNILLEFLLHNSTYILTIVAGIVGLFIMFNSIRLILKNNLLSKYKKYREKIKSFESVANVNKIDLYKKKSFLKLKNQGKAPCEIERKIEIDDFYLTDFSAIYIDLNEEIY